jgi:hypothetical protein
MPILVFSSDYPFLCIVLVSQRDETDVLSAPPPHPHHQGGRHIRQGYRSFIAWSIVRPTWRAFYVVSSCVRGCAGCGWKMLLSFQEQKYNHCHKSRLCRLVCFHASSPTTTTTTTVVCPYCRPFLDCHPDTWLRPESKKSIPSQSCILDGAFVPNTCCVWTPLPSSVHLVLASVATNMEFHTQWSVIPFDTLKDCTMLGVLMWFILLVSAHCTDSVPVCLDAKGFLGGTAHTQRFKILKSDQWSTDTRW